MKVRDTLPCVKEEKCARHPAPSSHLYLCLRPCAWARVHTCTNTEAHGQKKQKKTYRKPMPKDKSCAAEQKTTKKAIKTPAAGTHCD